jgi:hypothetical protein
MNQHPVQITIQHFNDCPNWLVTTERIERAIEAAGVDAEVRLQLITTPEAAEANNFRGSPTILVNGLDPFANPDAPVGLSCRVYATPVGMAGSPTRDQLTQAITSR